MADNSPSAVSSPVSADSTSALSAPECASSGNPSSALLRAEAIRIVGQSAKDFPEYRQQEFIGAFAEALKHGNIAQIIYVPTEKNIPIIEAGRAAK